MREALETAMHQQDSAEVERLRQQAQERRDDHLQQLSKHFASDPIDTDTVIGELNALRYMQRMLDQMDTPR